MCHFYRQGTCNKGSDCAFSHDLGHPDSFLCPYFLKGTCIYGDKCQFDHRMPVGDSSQPSNGGSTSASTDLAPSSATGASSESTSTSKLPAARKAWGTSEASKNPAAPGSLSAPPRTECVYFKSGECRFGNKCRFRHGAAQADSEGAIASLEKEMLNLNTGKSVPKAKPASKASPNGTKGAAPGANGQKKSVWDQRKSRQAAASGLTVYDDNQDVNDPWYRSQNTYLIPERTQMPQVENSDILCVTYTMTGECSYGEKCPFMHGELCETCGSHCLHPTDEDIRKEHIAACAEMLKETEAHARSKHVRHRFAGLQVELRLSRPDQRLQRHPVSGTLAAAAASTINPGPSSARVICAPVCTSICVTDHMQLNSPGPPVTPSCSFLLLLQLSLS